MANVVGGVGGVQTEVGTTVRAAPTPYPVRVTLDRPETSSRWLAVLGILWPLKALAALPVAAVTALLSVVQVVLAWYGFWAAVCTGRYPSTARRLQVDVVQLQTEVVGWLVGLTDAYPAFGLGLSTRGVAVQSDERGDPPVRYALWPFTGGVAKAPGANRWWAVLGVLWPLRALAALPHLVVVAVLGAVSLVLGWISFWAVLFTGRYPAGLWSFDAGVLRWAMRLWGFLLGLTDRYPPFRLA